jgi:hypothetical protein
VVFGKSREGVERSTTILENCDLGHLESLNDFINIFVVKKKIKIFLLSSTIFHLLIYFAIQKKKLF